jgi:hypothetical protein
MNLRFLCKNSIPYKHQSNAPKANGMSTNDDSNGASGRFIVPSNQPSIDNSMAHLTKPVKYDIKDSNIALLGSDVSDPVWPSK